jgi:hypothetical protein
MRCRGRWARDAGKLPVGRRRWLSSTYRASCSPLPRRLLVGRCAEERGCDRHGPDRRKRRDRGCPETHEVGAGPATEQEVASGTHARPFKVEAPSFRALTRSPPEAHPCQGMGFEHVWALGAKCGYRSGLFSRNRLTRSRRTPPPHRTSHWNPGRCGRRRSAECLAASPPPGPARPTPRSA